MSYKLNLKHCIAIALIAFLGVSCTNSNQYPTTKKMSIDNPLLTEITVQLDDKTYQIPPRSSQPVELVVGKHKLTYKGESVNFISKYCDQGAIINPTLTPYVFFHKLYVDPDNLERATAQWAKFEKESMHDYTLEDGTVIQVPMQVTNDLFIEQYKYYWHYDVNTRFPEASSIPQEYDYLSVVVFSKMFRLPDFNDYLTKNELLLPDGMLIKGEGPSRLSYLKPFHLVDSSIVYPCDKTNEMIRAVEQKFDSLSIATNSEIPGIIYRLSRMRYEDPTLNYDNKKDCDEANTPREQQFMTVVLKTAKALDSMGAMNAFVIK